jgi:branched-chain amino acid transport system ATP-binding protein
MLEISNLSVRYGRHRALDGVSAHVAKGEICVILGANGAGKSSLLKAVAGTVKAEPGSEIRMNGDRITGMKAHRIVEQGIALVPEGRGIFGELTVAENLQLGAFPGRARSREHETLTRIYALFPRLAERKSQIARTMSGGEQQMVAIGRALMSQPDILMLDEPSLGLSPVLTKELFRSLKSIAATGVGILLVEQNARQSLKIADRGYLIEVGCITGEGTAESLMNDPAVINAYLGGGVARPAAQSIRLPAPFVLPLDIAAMVPLIASFAARAGAIQSTFVAASRQQRAVPSAFAGRYDPARQGDLWDALGKSLQQSQGAPPVVSVDVKRISDRGSELARAAGQRMADHVKRQRRVSPVPSAFARNTIDPTQDELHGGLGHNSAGSDVEAGQYRAMAAIDIPALVSRAATIMSEHVASRRKPLTVVKLREEPPAKIKTTDSE